MHTRTLGQGLEVSAIGLGAMGMSQSYGPNPGDRDDMIGVLRYAVKLAWMQLVREGVLRDRSLELGRQRGRRWRSGPRRCRR